MSQIDTLNDIFANRLTVMSISNEMKIFALQEAENICSDNNYDILLVEDNDSELRLYEKESGVVRPINEQEVISESTPLIEAFEILCNEEFLLIKEKRNITKIVTRADLDSIPIRICLYGIISLFEGLLRENIMFNQIKWENHLNEHRLEEAKKLYRKKSNKNQEISLLNCTQFCDLGTIVKKEWDIYSPLIDDSKSNVDKKFKFIRKLRDSLAHSEKLMYDWNEILDNINFVRKVSEELAKHKKNYFDSVS